MPISIHPVLEDVTQRVMQRSAETRAAYLAKVTSAKRTTTTRMQLGCSNFAHGFAACSSHEKELIRAGKTPNIGIVTAYNDMLSAHEPFQHFPARIKQAVLAAGGTAQVAGGVPAMCDGITQSQPGMELSLFSRDVIAMSTAVALSHAMFDGVICLGTCDKIVPGLLMGALQFAHLPVIFIPAGPMPSGLPHPEKIKIREQFAQGKVGEDALLEAEAQSYHAPGTCTFYGTANSNQLLLEVMGLQLPGGTFVPPYTPLRDALTDAAAAHIVTMKKRPLYKIITEKSLLNGLVALLASGGSTNHTIHWMAIARAAGIILNWDDIDALSRITPLLCRIYPNGEKDVNAFHAAGGVPVMVQELLSVGLLHDDVETLLGKGLTAHTLRVPELVSSQLAWNTPLLASADEAVLATIQKPFKPEGGIRLLSGNLGRAVIKTSALKPELMQISAPCRMFSSQDDVVAAFERGELHRDMVVVLMGQGPKANGMPELHGLMAALGALVSLGYKIALVTDGRLSGASSKVPAAIHVTPEALEGSALCRLRDGDVVTLDAVSGTLKVEIPEAEFAARAIVLQVVKASAYGYGTELFGHARHQVGRAEEGASFIL